MIPKISLTAAFLLMIAAPMACASSRAATNPAPITCQAHEAPLGMVVAQNAAGVYEMNQEGAADNSNDSDSNSNDNADANQSADASQNADGNQNADGDQNADGNQNADGDQTDQQNADGNDQPIPVELKRGPKTNSVIVTDTGEGIPPEILNYVFIPFVSAQRPGVGTGLGLSFCRMIIEGCGGTISCRSKINVGTTFTIELPVVAPAVEHATAA